MSVRVRYSGCDGCCGGGPGPAFGATEMGNALADLQAAARRIAGLQAEIDDHECDRCDHDGSAVAAAESLIDGEAAIMLWRMRRCPLNATPYQQADAILELLRELDGSRARVG